MMAALQHLAHSMQESLEHVLRQRPTMKYPGLSQVDQPFLAKDAAQVWW